MLEHGAAKSTVRYELMRYTRYDHADEFCGSYYVAQAGCHGL